MTINQFLTALALLLLATLATRTPTSRVQTTEGEFVLVCGDDDGAEIPCDIDPPNTESCE